MTSEIQPEISLSLAGDLILRSMKAVLNWLDGKNHI